jgi:hypothetical protein
MIQAAEFSRNGHHRKASRVYQDMGNEIRNPSEKGRLWKLADESRKKGK